MNKDNGRVVDLEELKNLSIVGGNDNGGDRKSVVEGKSVGLGGRRIIKKGVW